MKTTNYLFVIRSFRLLSGHRMGKLILIFMLNLIIGLSQGFSIVLLIPLLQLLNIGGAPSDNPLTLFFYNLAQRTGITYTIESVLIIYIVLLTAIALLNYAQSLLSAGYQQTFIYTIRKRLFRKIILADWSELNSKSKTNHLQVLTKEVPVLAEYYFYYLRLITMGLMAAAHLVYAFAVSVQFTLLVLAVGLLLFIFLRKYLFRSFELGSSYNSSYNDLLRYIDNFWQTVKIAKVHSSEGFYYKKYEKANSSLLDMEYKLMKNYAFPQFFYRLAGIFILALVVYLGYRLGNVPVASFFILILLFARLFPMFTDINTDVNMIFSTMPSVKLVMNLDEQFSDATFPEHGEQPQLPLEREIRIEHLNFAYPDGKPLFTDFSETIPANRITGIIGESGLGKTTLIDLIAGLQKPGSGEITIDGNTLEDELLQRWKRSIGYLPQDSFFIDGTLRENLLWDASNNVSDEEVMETLRSVNAAGLVQRQPHGLDTIISNYQYHFSGGERQRLALARVLLRHPRLLLLDEATSSLDPENERQIMEVISMLKERVTIIFVTHRVSVLPWFDKVIRLSEGVRE